MIMSAATVLIFVGAGFIFYFFIFYLPDNIKLDGNDLPVTNFNFTEKIYPQLLDLGKFFLTILIGIFVASITFSEKIVNIHSSSWWAKSLLILCWFLLLLSIVMDGVGLIFLTNWYANELIIHQQSNMEMFEMVFYIFGAAGICFGLALSSMLCAGVISFISQINFEKGNTNIHMGANI